MQSTTITTNVDFFISANAIPGRIKLNADYQRGKVWRTEKKSLFIDSLLRGIPTPKLSIRKLCLDNEQEIFEIADGKQRLSSIYEFIQGDFTLPKEDCDNIKHMNVDYDISGKSFSQLPKALTNALTNAPITYDILINCSDEEVTDYFRRINNGQTISAFEKRNSILGNIKQMIDLFANHNMCKLVGKEKKVKQKEYCERAIFIAVNKNIESLDHKTLKKFHENNKKLPIELYSERIKKTLDCLFAVFDGNKLKTFKQTGESVALFKIFYENQFTNLEELSTWYSETLSERNEKKGTNTAFATTTFTKIQNIYDIFKNSLDKWIENGKIQTKDKKRIFTDEQKIILYANAKGICQKCGKKLHHEDFHADHITPHSKGGKTELNNGQLLCVECNLNKSDKLEENQ